MSKPEDCVAMAAQILSAYLTRNNVPPPELPTLLREIYQALRSVQTGDYTPTVVANTPAVPIKRSVTEDHVVCLVCGVELQSLKRHLGTKHNLTPDQYRARFGLSPDHSIVAPSYSRTRSQLAMESGLGRKSSGRRSKR